jgi:hypothetical protein
MYDVGGRMAGLGIYSPFAYWWDDFVPVTRLLLPITGDALAHFEEARIEHNLGLARIKPPQIGD